MWEVLKMGGMKGRHKYFAPILAAVVCLTLLLHNGIANQQEASQGNPRVQIIAPQNGATFVKETVIPIVYQAWSPDGTPLIRAEAYVDGVRGDEGLTYNPPTTSVQETLEWDATFFRDGPHTITIRVFDARNRMGEASVTIYKGADTTKPKAEILSPKSGSVVRGVVAIIARFEDDRQLAQVGVKATSQDEKRKHYILYAKGGVFRERIYEATVLWDTASAIGGSPVFPDGLYILQAWAVDGQGQEGASPEVLVTVRNQSVEAVIQRPETSPRGGERPLVKPSYGAVIIARPAQLGEARAPLKQPTPEISIIPAPIVGGVRQLPSVELSPTRLSVSGTLVQLLSTPVVRGESLTKFEKSYEPMIAPLKAAVREGVPVGLPVLSREGGAELKWSTVMREGAIQPLRVSTGARVTLPASEVRELANVGVGVVSLPRRVSVGRGMGVEVIKGVAEPAAVVPSQVLRPVTAAPTPEPRLLSSATRRTETVSKPVKPAPSAIAQLMPMELPRATRSVFVADMTAARAMRSSSAKMEVIGVPKPEIVSPIAGVSPVVSPSPKANEPLILSRSELARVHPTSVSRVTEAAMRAYSVGAPSAVQPAVYGIAMVKPSERQTPIASALPRQVKARDVLPQQSAIAVSPSHGRAQVQRTQVALPTSTPPRRSRAIDVGVLRRAPAALPSIHVQRGVERPTIVITRRRSSFTYTVQPGDTLCGIARKFKLTLKQLMDANSLREPIKLRTGQRLVIPRTPISVKCGGQAVSTDVQPYLLFGTALTPFRPIVEFAGGSVEWVNSEKRVLAQWDNKRIHLRIDDPKASINGESLLLKPAPFLLLNRTIVPARLFERIFEVPVIWNRDEAAVEIGLSLNVTQTQSGNTSSQEAQK